MDDRIVDHLPIIKRRQLPFADVRVVQRRERRLRPHVNVNKDSGKSVHLSFRPIFQYYQSAHTLKFWLPIASACWAGANWPSAVLVASKMDEEIGRSTGFWPSHLIRIDQQSGELTIRRPQNSQNRPTHESKSSPGEEHSMGFMLSQQGYWRANDRLQTWT
jgi:hypothetical protein